MTEVPIMVMPWHRPDPCKPLRMQTDAAFKPTYLDYLSSLSLDSPPLPVPLTAVVATIGHASNHVDTLVELMKAGMTTALVPLSQGTRQDHVTAVARLRTACTAYGQALGRVYPLGVAVQTKGPGIRIGGLVKDAPVDLPLKHRVTLTTDRAWRTRGTEHFLYVGHSELPDVLRQGDHVLIGNVVVRVDVVDGNELVCEVMNGGVVQSFMSVSVPDVPLRLPAVAEEDVEDLRLAAALGVDAVLASRTQDAHHLGQIRKVLADEANGSGIKVWAVIESRQALNNLESILEEADAVVLSRIGLAQDMASEKLFVAQKIAIATANKAGVPVFLSSHFLPSMQTEVAPPIAELADVAAAILDGCDGFVLRNTTAVGRCPDAAVRALVAQAVEAEAAVWHHQTFHYLSNSAVPPVDPTHAIAMGAVAAAEKAAAAAILLATTSGRSAQLVARFRPRCPVVAVTRYGQVARQLNAWRAVIPLQYVDPPLPDWTREVDVRLQFAIEFAKLVGVVKLGDPLVLLNGWRQGAGFTNTIRVVYANDSFPWVYPHRIPSTVPSDRDISEKDSPLSSSILQPSKFISSGATRSRVSRADSRASEEVDGKYFSSQRSMEAELRQITDTRSKEFELTSMSGNFQRSKAETLGGGSAPRTLTAAAPASAFAGVAEGHSVAAQEAGSRGSHASARRADRPPGGSERPEDAGAAGSLQEVHGLT